MESAVSEASAEDTIKTQWTDILVESSLEPLGLPLQGSTRLRYTCISVSKRYIALGSSTGGIYIFGRQNLNNLRVVFGDMKTDPIHLVSLSPIDNNVGFANSMGQVFVMGTNIDKRSKPEKLRMSNIHVGRVVTAVCWNASGSQFFIGDNMGTVSIAYISTSKAKDLFTQPLEVILNLDSAVGQMDWAGERLLLSTLSRCYLCFTDRAKYFQIGKKLREGTFGTSFYYNSTISTPLIFCARPGSRVWEVDFEGQVLNTHQFKQLLAIPPLPVINLKDEELDFQEDGKWSLQSVNFVRIKQIKNFLLAWTTGAIYILDPLHVRAVLWTAEFKDITDIDVWENELYVFYQETELQKLTLMPIEMCASWLHSRQNTKLAEDILNHFVISFPPSLQSSLESPYPSFKDALSQPEGSYLLPKIVPKDMAATSRLATLPAENGAADKAIPQCTVERPWDALDKPNPVFSSLDQSPRASPKNSNNLQVDRLSLFLKSPDQNGTQPYIEDHKSPSEFFESSIQQILIENDESDVNPILTSPENSEEPLDQIFDQEVLHRSAAAFSLQTSFFSEYNFSSGRSTLKPMAIPRPRPSNPSPYNTTLMSPSVYAMLNYTNVTQFEASDQITETEEGSPNLDAVPLKEQTSPTKKVFKKKKPTIVKLGSPDISVTKETRPKERKLRKRASTVDNSAEEDKKSERPHRRAASVSIMEASGDSSEPQDSSGDLKSTAPQSTDTSPASEESYNLESSNCESDQHKYGSPDQTLSHDTDSSSSKCNGSPMKQRRSKLAHNNSTDSADHGARRMSLDSNFEPPEGYGSVKTLASSVQDSYAAYGAGEGQGTDTESPMSSTKLNLISIKDSLSSKTKSFIKSFSKSNILSRGDQLVNRLKGQLPDIIDGKEIIEPEALEASEVEEEGEVIECLEDMDEEIYADAVENVIAMNEEKMSSLIEATDKAKEDLSSVEILLHPDRVEKVVCKWLLHLHLSQSTVFQNMCKSEDCDERSSLLKDVDMECESENVDHHGDRRYSRFIDRDDKDEPIEPCPDKEESIAEVGVFAEEHTSKSKPDAQVEDVMDRTSVDTKGDDQMVSTSSLFGCTKSVLEESDEEEVKWGMQDENMPEDSSPKAAQMENLENLKKSRSADDRTYDSSLFGKSPTTGDSSTCDDSDDHDNRKKSKKRQKEEKNQKEKEQKIPNEDKEEDLEISPKENQCFESFLKDSFEEGSVVPEKLSLEQSTSASQCKEKMEASRMAESEDLESELQKSNEASNEAILNPPASDDVKSPTHEEPVKADRKLDSVSSVTDFPWKTGEEFFQMESCSQPRSSARWMSRKVGRWLISDEVCSWSAMGGDKSDWRLGRHTDSLDLQSAAGDSEVISTDQDWTDDHGLEESGEGSEELQMSSSDKSNNDGSSVFEKSVIETATSYDDSTLERRPFRKLPEMSTDAGSLLQTMEYSIQDFGGATDAKTEDTLELNESSTHKNGLLIFQDTKLLLKCFVSDPFVLSREYHNQISELATLCFRLGLMGSICSKVFQSSCYVQCSSSNLNNSFRSVDLEIGSKGGLADIPCRNIGLQTPKQPGCMDSYCNLENQYQTKCTCGTYCHLAGKFDQLHKSSSSRSHCLNDCLLTSADHFDLQMSLFIRCYFHCLSLDVVKSHVYNDNGYCFRSWMALVQCIQECNKEDLIGQSLEKNKMQQAMELLHSEEITFSILNVIVGHIARLFSFRPAGIVAFSIANPEHVHPLDMLYFCQLHSYSLHHFHQYMMTRLNSTTDKKALLNDLCSNKEIHFTWLQHLLYKVDEKRSTEALPSVPVTGIHLLKWKYQEIIRFLCKKISDDDDNDEEFVKKVLNTCLSNRYWLGCSLCLRLLKQWKSHLIVLVALGDATLFHSDLYGYIPQTDEQWVYLVHLQEIHDKEDKVAFNTLLINIIAELYEENELQLPEDLQSLANLEGGGTDFLNEDLLNSSCWGRATLSQLRVTKFLTLEFVCNMLIKNVGPEQGVDLLLQSNLLELSTLPLSFYQTCLLGSLIQSQQRLVTHNMLEKIDAYLWSRKPVSMAPAIHFAVDQEKTAESLSDITISQSELLNQLHPLTGKRFAEEMECHWGCSVDILSRCPCCNLNVSEVISHMESGIVVFDCGHAYHRCCVGRRKKCIICSTVR